MARNKYPGRCYCCGQWTPPGYGHFERHGGHWRIKCVKCASGRALDDKDPGVIWAQKAAKEAAEVVRCRDCKWFNLKERECESAEVATDHEGGASFSLNFGPDDFCSYGERMEKHG